MTKTMLYQTVDEYDEEAGEDPTDDPGVLQKTLLRDEYTTRNVKYLFFGLLTVAIGATIFWILQQPTTGLLGTDLGRFVGYLTMGITASIVVVTAISVVVKSLYLGGRSALTTGTRR